MLSKDHLIKRSVIQQSIAASQSSLLWSMTSWYWPSFWSYGSLGHHITRLMTDKNYSKTSVYKILLKNILRSFVSRSAHIVFPKAIGSAFSDYESIIFGWATQEQVPLVLSGEDIYFGKLSEKEKQNSLRLISLVGSVSQELVNKLLDAKIAVICWKKDKLKPFKVLSIFFHLLIEKKVPLKDWYKYLDSTFIDAQMIEKSWKDQLALMSQLKYFFIPYEAQPMQQMLLSVCHRCSPLIQTIGYLHSTLVPFPFDMIHTPCSPKILWVHGKAYQSILSSYLHWPKESIHLISSLRYTAQKSFEPKIYLPISLEHKEKLLYEIDAFLFSCKNKIKPLKIGIHPGRLSDPLHLDFSSKLEALLKKHDTIFSSDGEEICVIFGITSALFEALENGFKVINIISNKEYEIYSSDIFPSLRVCKITDYTYSYDLDKKGSYILYEKEKNRKDLTDLVLN